MTEWFNSSREALIGRVIGLEKQLGCLKNAMLDSKDIYVLLADGDGTMRSVNEPFGVAVDSLDEAERYKKDGGVGYSHSFTKVKLFSNKDDAIRDIYPDYKQTEVNNAS